MTRFRPTGRTVGLTRSRGNTLRPVEWIRACESFNAAPSTITIASPLVTAAEFDEFTRPTVVRIRGHIQFSIADITNGNLGLAVYGITIINQGEPPPDPFAQRRGNRWLWWGCMALNEQGTTVDSEDQVSSFVERFDVKSMRKRLVDGSSLVVCFVNLPIGTLAPAMTFSYGSSTLVKE